MNDYIINYITPIGPLVIRLDIDKMLIISSVFVDGKIEENKRTLNSAKIVKSLVGTNKNLNKENSNELSAKTNELNIKIIEAEKIIIDALDNYFKSYNKNISDVVNNKINKYINIEELVGTKFQKNVWRIISNVKYGQSINYTELALETGVEGGARAAGSACGKNPLAIFIPCHRVLRKSGEDYSYSWGKDRKKWLLSHESINIKTK